MPGLGTNRKSSVHVASVSSWNKGDMAAVRLGARKCLLSTPKQTLADQALPASVRPEPDDPTPTTPRRSRTHSTRSTAGAFQLPSRTLSSGSYSRSDRLNGPVADEKGMSVTSHTPVVE
jgi:hypothetical protein